MVDVFDEVEEQLRSDHYKRLARRYVPWIGGVLAIALLAALSVWGYTRYQAMNAQKASEAYALGLDTLGRNDQAAAYTAFGEAAKSPSPAYRSLALMQQAGIRLNQSRTPEALTLLDQAAQASTAPVLADAARLKSALALLDTASYADIEARLKPLTDANRPYAPLAREALAIAKLKAGKTNEARSDFVVLSLMADAPDDVRDRAKAAMALIDSGGVSGLSAIVKTAQTLPPPPPTPAAPQGGPDSQTSQAGAAQ